MKRTQFFLPQQLIERLKTLAKKTGLSVAEHVRRAIEKYLDRIEK